MGSAGGKAGDLGAGAPAAENAGFDVCAGDPPEEQIALPWSDLTGQALAAAQANRKAGRPTGAQSGAKIRAALLAGGFVPQLELRKWLQHGPIALARMLGMSNAEAFALWAKHMEGLGKYTLAPLAPVDGDGRAAPTIAVLVGGQSGVVDAQGVTRAPWEYIDLPAEEIQQVSAGGAGESQDELSKEGEK